MKRTRYFILLLGLVAGLVGCNGTTGIQQQCKFTKTSVVRDSTLKLQLPSDTPETYTFRTQAVNMDSLVTSLCEKGFLISSGWYATGYLCMDARGPRPEIILGRQDTTILHYGFYQGNDGRLECSRSFDRYTP